MKLNPELKKDDRIVLIKMFEEIGIPPLTKGIVIGLNDTPFGLQYSVEWDNGSRLDLIPEVDNWVFEEDYLKKKSERKPIKESLEETKWMVENKDILKHFKLNKFYQYLELIRKSGITNMLGASPLLYIGGEMLDRLNPYPPDEDAFQEAVGMANEVKDELIRGTVKYLESKDMEVSIENVKRYAQKFSTKLLEVFMKFHV